MGTSANTVAAGLAAIDKKKKAAEIAKFLELLDDIDASVPEERNSREVEPIRRPYSGHELPTTDKWK